MRMKVCGTYAGRNQRTRWQWKPSLRTHLTALCILCAALVSACGGGNDGAGPDSGVPDSVLVPDASVPDASVPDVGPPLPPPPSIPQLDATVLSLYESASVPAFLAGLPFVEAFYWRSVWTSGPCPWAGSMEVFLDGSAPAPGTMLAPGSHTLAVSYALCRIYGGGWEAETNVNGVASAAYTTTDLNDLTAVVSLSSVQGTGNWMSYRSALDDVTADGSGTWTRLRTDTLETTTYTPTIGSTLVNNATSNVATFQGGSYSSSDGPRPSGASAVEHEEFDKLAVAISGTSYTLNGNLHSFYGFSSEITYTGEVRITSNGTLVARIYGDASGALRTEVLSPLVPF
jgi:hypothetical protein